MAEIKMKYADVEAQIDQMNNAGSSLDPSKPEPISGNTLNVVDKLTNLSDELEGLLLHYQEILASNNQTTAASVQSMKETDELISTGITSSINGPRMMAH